MDLHFFGAGFNSRYYVRRVLSSIHVTSTLYLSEVNQIVEDYVVVVLRTFPMRVFVNIILQKKQKE